MSKRQIEGRGREGGREGGRVMGLRLERDERERGEERERESREGGREREGGNGGKERDVGGEQFCIKLSSILLTLSCPHKFHSHFSCPS